jgi:hypothetical protein
MIACPQRRAERTAQSFILQFQNTDPVSPPDEASATKDQRKERLKLDDFKGRIVSS